MLPAWVVGLTVGDGCLGGLAADFDFEASGDECVAGVAGKRPPSPAAPEDTGNTVPCRQVLCAERPGLIRGRACKSVNPVVGRYQYQYAQSVWALAGRRDDPDPECLAVWAGQHQLLRRGEYNR
jgi:hypothetical protein